MRLVTASGTPTMAAYRLKWTASYMPGHDEPGHVIGVFGHEVPVDDPRVSWGYGLELPAVDFSAMQSLIRLP